MDAKLKHLEFIQDAIKRMAGNSFLLRGWSITLVIAIFTLASQTYKPIYYWIALFITLVFWLLDSYYLHQEKRFRCLYNEVRAKDPDSIDFSMTLPKNHCGKCSWLSAARSHIFTVFYGLTTVILAATLFCVYFNVSITLK
jgi:type IV secretory pathway TrbD component